MTVCRVNGCENRLLAKGLCNRHYKLKRKYGDENYPIKRPSPKGSGSTTSLGYRVVAVGGERILEHVAVAENALGKKLPAGAIVHHVDGDRANNLSSNLVVCPDQAYHLLLHARQRAYGECGDASYRKCMNCGRWDDPRHMKWHKSTTYYHKPASLCKGV